MAQHSAPHARPISFGDDGWSAVIAGSDPAWEDWAATLLALSNGSIGVRGTIDELAEGAATTFLAHGYEQTPIAYHERFQGFADSTDTRVPVAEPLAIAVAIDGAALDFAAATMLACKRRIDLRNSREGVENPEDKKTHRVDEKT